MRPRRRVRIGDLTAWAERGDRESLTAALGHRDPQIRAAAVPLVAQFRDEGTARSLVPHLDDPEWLVRKAVVEALANMGQAAVPAVLDALDGDESGTDVGFLRWGAAEVVIRTAALLDEASRRRAETSLNDVALAQGDTGRAGREALAAVKASAPEIDDVERDELRKRLMHPHATERTAARRDLAWIVGSEDGALSSAYEASERLDRSIATASRTDAITMLEAAVAIEPEFATAQIVLARLHRYDGSLEEANRDIAAALEVDANSADAWVEAGLNHVAALAPPRALGAFTKAIALDPDAACPRVRPYIDLILRRLEAWDLVSKLADHSTSDGLPAAPAAWQESVRQTSRGRLRKALYEAVEDLPPGTEPADWLPSLIPRRKGSKEEAAFTVDPLPRSARVFVSSTFRDFHDERDLLVRRVFPELRRRCEDRLVDVVDIDLRWGIQQEQAERGEALGLCLAELDRCRPFFIGLLGQSFGTRVEDASLVEYPWIQTDRPHSFTAVEVQYALRSGPSEESLFYFRDREFLRRLSPEVRTDFESQRNSDATALNALKDEIRQSLRQANGPEPREYEQPSEFSEMVLEDLWAIIDDRFPAATVPDIPTRIRMRHRAIANSLTRAYVPVAEDLRRLDDHVRRRGGSLFVAGAPGMGKSSLLANWAKRSRETDPELRVVEHYVPGTASGEAPNDLIAHIAAELGGTDLIPQRTDADNLKRAITAILARAATETDLVLVVDGVDRLRPKRGQHPLDWIPASLPKGVWLICSTDSGEISAELQRRGWPGHTLSGLSPGERSPLIDAYLERFGKQLQPELVDQIVNAPQCSEPRFLKSLIEELRVFGGFAELADRTRTYLTAESTEAFYDMVIERLEKDFAADAPGLVRACFASLWASRNGLTESQLVEVSQAMGHEVPRRTWSALLASVAAWVPDVGGTMTIGSDSFRSAVAAKYLSNEADQRAVHHQLADMLDAGPDGPFRHELPWQLSRAAEWDRLYGVLSDPDRSAALHRVDPAMTLEHWAGIEAATEERRDLAFAPVTANPERYAESVWNIADILEDGGYVDSALVLREWIAHRATEAGDPLAGAAATGDLGIALRLAGDWERAERQFRRQEEQAVLADDRDSLVKAFTNQGLVLADLGRLEEAQSKHEQAEAICRAHDDWPGLSIALGNLALVHGTAGNTGRAEVLLEEQIRISRQIDDIEGVMIGLGNLGAAKLGVGDIDAAAEHLGEQERLARRIGARNVLARSLTSQGSIAAERGQGEEAMRLLAESESICRAIGDDLALAGVLGNRSVVFRQLGDLDASLEVCREEEAICRRLNHPPGLAHSLMQQALLHADMGDTDMAIQYSQRAKDYWVPLGDAPNLMRVAELLADLGRNDEAAEVALVASRAAVQHGAQTT